MGGNDPLSLNLSLFYCISQHFGTRGCQEHHQLRVEDIKFVRNPTDGTTEYIEWNEGPTKDQAGWISEDLQEGNSKDVVTGQKNCPVKFLEILWKFFNQKDQQD